MLAQPLASDSKKVLQDRIANFLNNPPSSYPDSSATVSMACQTALDTLNETQNEWIQHNPGKAKEYIFRLNQPYIKPDELINTLTHITLWLAKLCNPNQFNKEILSHLVWSLARCQNSPHCSQEIKDDTLSANSEIIRRSDAESFNAKELRRIILIDDYLDGLLEKNIPTDITPLPAATINAHLNWLIELLDSKADSDSK